VIDEDAAHDVRGDAKKVRPILPVNLPLVDEPDEHFVHEGRRLQCVVGPLASKLTGGHASELCIHEGQQLVERGPVTAAPLAEQLRDVARRERPAGFGGPGLATDSGVQPGKDETMHSRFFVFAITCVIALQMSSGLMAGGSGDGNRSKTLTVTKECHRHACSRRAELLYGHRLERPCAQRREDPLLRARVFRRGPSIPRSLGCDRE
jgi:hypothetical protein